jgi:hypothetical protein
MLATEKSSSRRLIEIVSGSADRLYEEAWREQIIEKDHSPCEDQPYCFQKLGLVRR